MTIKSLFRVGLDFEGNKNNSGITVSFVGNDQLAICFDENSNSEEEEIVMKNNESMTYKLFDMSSMTDAILESTTIDFYQILIR